MGREIGKEKCDMGFHLKGEEKMEEKKKPEEIHWWLTKKTQHGAA